MAHVIGDDVDFGAYMRDTECSAKVRKASAFADDLAAEFATKRGNSDPEMFSTKLRGLLGFRPGEVTAWAGYNGHRKALALDTPIPTPSGWTTMASIEPGAVVFDENGAPCNVVAKSRIFFDEECYRVVFSDGSTIVAHAGHEWLTDTAQSRQSARTAKRNKRVPGQQLRKFGSDQSHKRAFPSIRTTREIAETLIVTEGGFAGHRNHSVKVAGALQLPEASLPVAPYVLGAWLGDGTSLDGTITVADAEVIEQFVGNGYQVRKQSAPLRYGIPGLKVALRELCVLGNKHVPAIYMRASEHQRLELLRGLCDTDGCAKKDGTLEFCSTSEALAESVRELVCSLGMQCTLARGTAKLYGREIGPKFTVLFSASRRIFHIDRKQERSKVALSDRITARFIVACERVDSVPVQCVQVDSQSHLYLAGRSMIPTHNSMFTGQVALDLCVQRQRVLVVSLEMSPARTLARMVRQAAAVSHPGSEFLREFTRWTDGRLWLFDHLGRITPDLCLALLRYFAQELQGQHVFIDSMMMVCKSEEHLDEQKQFTTDLVRVAQETGLHVHLVAHCRKPQTGEDKPPSKYDLRGSAAISDQCPNVVTIWANKLKAAKLQVDPHDAAALADFDALVSVEKQRNGEFEGRVKLWFHRASMRFLDDRVSACEPYHLEVRE